MAGKYWETEQPQVLTLGKNQFRYFPEAGKLQVYPIVQNAPNGVGRGATIDLRGMAVEELQQLGDLIQKAVREELNAEVGA